MKNRALKGFTLVELMVVVAIIGILASVAVPSFKKYQSRSRTTEATIALSNVYTLEQSIFSEYDTFASCIVDLGLPYTSIDDGFYYTSATYYVVGFQDLDHGGPTWGNEFIRSKGVSCRSNSGLHPHAVAGTKVVSGNMECVHTTAFGTLVVNIDPQVFDAVTFKAFAIGAVKGGIGTDSATWSVNDLDAWFIDQNKRIVHFNVGY